MCNDVLRNCNGGRLQTRVGGAKTCLETLHSKSPEVPVVDTVVVETETAPVSAVSWPAIIDGGFVAAAVTLLLLALGAGLGFSVVSPWRGTPDITHHESRHGGRHLSGRYRCHGPRPWAATLPAACAPAGRQSPRDEVFFRDTATAC